MRLRDENLDEFSFEELFHLFRIKEDNWIVGEPSEVQKYLDNREDLSELEKDILISFLPCHEDLFLLSHEYQETNMEITTNIFLMTHFYYDERLRNIFSKWKGDKENLPAMDKKYFSEIFGSDLYMNKIFSLIDGELGSDLKKEVKLIVKMNNDAEVYSKKFEHYLFRLYRRRQYDSGVNNFSALEKREFEKLLFSDCVSEVAMLYLKCIWPRVNRLDSLQGLFEKYRLKKIYDQKSRISFEELVKVKALYKFYNFLLDGLNESPRIYLEEIEEFNLIKFLPDELRNASPKNGYIDVSEEKVQNCIEGYLRVPFHKKDWGGEENDLYANQVTISGINGKLSAAFLLKGNGLRKDKMEISDCGKNGDQIVRLFQSPAELFVIQYVGNISENLIKDVESKVMHRRLSGRIAWFCIIDGQETAKILHFANK